MVAVTRKKMSRTTFGVTWKLRRLFWALYSGIMQNSRLVTSQFFKKFSIPVCVCVFFLPLVFHTIEILSRLLRRFIDVERGKKKGTILKMETFLCRAPSCCTKFFFFSAFRFHAYGSINLLLFSKSYIQCLKRLSLLLRGLKKFHD